MKVVLCTGGFDPLHSGHIEYLKCAASLGNSLIVGLNSDEWLERKKGKAFLPFYEREQIISNLSFVHNVINFDDWDDSAIEAILKVKRFYKNAEVVVANGGDRTNENTPEAEFFKSDGWISFAYGVGGADKKNSSSNILEKWATPHTERPWGHYRVIHNESNIVKVKELVVQPGQELSLQKHHNRAEHWFITKGVATVYDDNECLGEYKMFDNLHIEREQWHKLANRGESLLKIVEIQYGSDCSEEDIVRQNDTIST